MIGSNHARRGQALLMVTLALFAMGGVLGLAVDLGWSYYVKKSAQAAADAAALGAAYQALANVGETAAFPSGTYTRSLSSCPETGVTALSNGCQYAQSNGFSHGARQDVTMVSGVNSAPPTVSSITADYWVTARAVQTIPQLFSAILGNPTGLVAARSTAAVISEIVNGSLITLDRGGDGLGANVTLKGHGEITVPSGLIVANNSSNAIDTNGATTINGPIVALTPLANPGAGGNNTFQNAVDGPQFLDPMRGAGQPPLPSTPLNTYAVMQGNLAGTIYQVDTSTNKVISVLTVGGGSPVLPSGNYFPATCTSQCTSNPIGAVAPLSGGLSTGNGTITFSGGTFGSYLFYGGLNISGTLNMGAGEYVVVGGGLDDTGVLQAPNSGNDAGQLFIVTGSSGPVSGTYPNLTNNAASNLYPGLLTQLNSNVILATMAGNSNNNFLAFGQTTFFKSADGTGDPSGLNPNVTGLPSNLNPFAGVVFWQDQADSSVNYTSNGNINTSCGSINSPCTNSYATTSATDIDFHAQGDASMKGIWYQPRGACIDSIGHGNSGDISGALMVITGCFKSNGGGGINVTQPPIPLRRRVTALIE